ncbi:hypothetical protein JM84_1940 [Dokdonia sp. Hel_I_63]|uniref:hypothetical protein n=2 Tax=unclassified Dokdonia TaxID=2615033 RepID=UPI00020A6C0F|nr:hypothetical protein [Dokdonia sp. 4H-3-7-5]AEE20720.1 hypothetical protein Krodi_2745 [Dokdonia sp. 4H-3-7-5]TVZ23024.1 hypothetical protein JM84_1940 [Dokdonia sp. Hel_I_63]
MTQALEHHLSLSFGEITVYNDYVYTIMNEGITVQPNFNDILLAVAEIYYSDREFVYITHRINSYSIDPIIYLETSKIKNLKGFIAVCPNKSLIESFRVEKLFFNKPFAVYQTLDEALKYKEKLLSGEH